MTTRLKTTALSTLLVGLLAWAADPRRYPRGGRPDVYHPTPPSVPPRFLGGADALTFVAHRPDRPGGCVVADARGCRWYVPTDFIEARA